jgi:hypothetical protein
MPQHILTAKRLPFVISFLALYVGLPPMANQSIHVVRLYVENKMKAYIGEETKIWMKKFNHENTRCTVLIFA